MSVATSPTSSTLTPWDVTPAMNASANASDEILISRPTASRGAATKDAKAAPIASAMPSSRSPLSIRPRMS